MVGLAMAVTLLVAIAEGAILLILGIAGIRWLALPDDVYSRRFTSWLQRSLRGSEWDSLNRETKVAMARRHRRWAYVIYTAWTFIYVVQRSSSPGYESLAPARVGIKHIDDGPTWILLTIPLLATLFAAFRWRLPEALRSLHLVIGFIGLLLVAGCFGPDAFPWPIMVIGVLLAGLGIGDYASHQRQTRSYLAGPDEQPESGLQRTP